MHVAALKADMVSLARAANLIPVKIFNCLLNYIPDECRYLFDIHILCSTFLHSAAALTRPPEQECYFSKTIAPGAHSSAALFTLSSCSAGTVSSLTMPIIWSSS